VKLIDSSAGPGNRRRRPTLVRHRERSGGTSAPWQHSREGLQLSGSARG
jgi:hypothetical protein